MKLTEYAGFDPTGLAGLVAGGDVSASEVSATVQRAIDAANPAINAAVETYPDRIEGLDEARFGTGPFR